MPIKPENKALYPKNWKQISERIRYERAGNKCEECGVRNHAVGYRDKVGVFHPTAGNKWHDEAGMGLVSYKEAAAAIKEFNKHWNEGLGPDGEKAIMIVLTVAHLDHNPANCEDSNLKALCQKCHNNYDNRERLRNRRKQTELFPKQLTA